MEHYDPVGEQPQISIDQPGAEVDARQLDAGYRSFPPFSEWSKLSVDTVRWDRYSVGLEQRGKMSSEQLAQARKIALRAAAVDTGAIEGLYDVDRGFTMTIAMEAAAWEAALDQRGQPVRSLIEAQLNGYDYLVDLATKAEPISEAAIRALHAQLVSAQETYRVVTAIGLQDHPLPKGQYKLLPNHVRRRDGEMHSYAPADLTPADVSLRGRASKRGVHQSASYFAGVLCSLRNRGYSSFRGRKRESRQSSVVGLHVSGELDTVAHIRRSERCLPHELGVR